MKGDTDSLPNSIKDSSIDDQTDQEKPPELKHRIPPLVPSGKPILPPIRRPALKRVKASIWETFIQFLQPIEIFRLSQASWSLKRKIMQSQMAYSLIGEQFHTSMGVCKAQQESQTRTDDWLQAINVFQLKIKSQIHYQSRKRFHGLIFGLFIIAILQSVLLSLWDGFSISLELTFIPAPLALLLILFMFFLEISSYARARKNMKIQLDKNKQNLDFFPEFSGRRFIHPKLFPLYDFRHSSLGDYLLASLGVFFIAFAITLKAYILGEQISYLVTLMVALMPLFVIKLVIFLVKYLQILHKRKRSHLKKYKQWIQRKGIFHRVSYSQSEINQIGSQKCCANHMLIPGWIFISTFFGIFIALAGLRLDERVSTSWFLIFLPVWIISLPLCVLAVFKGLTIGEKGQRSKCEDLFWALLIPISLLLSLVLILLYAEGFPLYSLSLLFIPFYLGCLALYVFMRFVNSSQSSKNVKIKPKQQQ